MIVHTNLTWQAIRWSLIPPASTMKTGTTPLDRLRSFLADPSSAVAPDGSFSVSLPDCSRWGAPFILFRLKRLGFSACRVYPENGGLTVHGRR
jgi:hypothetical protein